MAFYHQIFMILCVCVVFTIAQSPPQAPPPSPPPHSFVFALQWPRSFCNTAQRVHNPCISPIPGSLGFKIHGLWPQDSNGNSLKNCAPAGSLNRNTVYQYSFIADLQNYWPNLKGQDFAFWEHEWDIHGTCSGQTPEDYFQSAISIIKRIDLVMGHPVLDCFSQNRLRPSAKYLYKPSAFARVIFQKAHVVANITCNFDSAGKNQLHEIRFCTDGNRVLRNCPHRRRGRHNSIVYDMRGCNTGGISFPT